MSKFKQGPAEETIVRLLKFLHWLYNNIKKPTKLSLTRTSKDMGVPYFRILGTVLKEMGIINMTGSNRNRFYSWCYLEAPQRSLAIKVIKSCYDYDYAHKTSSHYVAPSHIAPTKKYLIPFMANDLRYVNTIEEGIELISSAIVAAGDYNIYQLVTKVQKISRIEITNIAKS